MDLPGQLHLVQAAAPEASRPWPSGKNEVLPGKGVKRVLAACCLIRRQSLQPAPLFWAPIVHSRYYYLLTVKPPLCIASCPAFWFVLAAGFAHEALPRPMEVGLQMWRRQKSFFHGGMKANRKSPTSMKRGIQAPHLIHQEKRKTQLGAPAWWLGCPLVFCCRRAARPWSQLANSKLAVTGQRQLTKQRGSVSCALSFGGRD